MANDQRRDRQPCGTRPRYNKSTSCSGLIAQSDKILRNTPGPTCAYAMERRLRGRLDDAGNSDCRGHATSRSLRLPRPSPVLFPLDAGAYSCGDRDPLNANELQVCRLLTFYFKTKLNGFANLDHEFVERGAIGVTTRQLRHRGDVHALLVSLDNDIKLARHASSLAPWRARCVLPLQTNLPASYPSITTTAIAISAVCVMVK